MAEKPTAIATRFADHGVRVTIRRGDGQVLRSIDPPVFEVCDGANVDDYGLAMTQQDGVRVYELDFAALGLPAGFYQLHYQQPAGTVLDKDDLDLGTENWDWDGTARTYPANTKKLNDVPLVGDGSETPWGPG